MSVHLYIPQTNKPYGKITEVRIESFAGYAPLTAIITPVEARWFMNNETVHFFTQVAGTSESIPVTKYGDECIRSQKNKTDEDNLFNLPDIKIEPGIKPLVFRELQDWVKQTGEPLDIPPVYGQ
jgi:hypothetical protein